MDGKKGLICGAGEGFTCAEQHSE